MRISRLQIISAVVLPIVALSAASRAQDQKSPSKEERMKAINLVRAIKVRYYAGTANGANDGHGRFASWPELYSSGLVKELQVSRGPEAIPGYHLVTG